MTDDEPIDNLLRDSMASAAIPALSSQFEQRMARRLPRRRSPRHGRFLIGYAAIALAASIGTMHASGLSWKLILPAAVLPIAGAILLVRRHR